MSSSIVLGEVDLSRTPFLMDTKVYADKNCSWCGKRSVLQNVVFVKYQYWFCTVCHYAERNVSKKQAVLSE